MTITIVSTREPEPVRLRLMMSVIRGGIFLLAVSEMASSDWVSSSVLHQDLTVSRAGGTRNTAIPSPRSCGS